ncbi:MAG: 3-methyl-2-oxobutanoate hydroxymethyltransferase [Oscillospiraceae bacterium]|nr:3-methyl-2-oxobutanoate hydroxymethyltransferase [Oscillospiraceae bacterium]MDY3257743.1 3-methyl-2-oxobutanoate hydroxymethyltransferase [Ruminococcus callidus]
MKKTIENFKAMKAENQKISMLTAYDYTTAKIFDNAGIDTILVGDSLGNVVMGYENTIPVTMEDMIHHTACVSRACENAFVVADMPFMSYQTSVYDAVANAGRLMKEGRANAVKLEGGVSMKETIKAIVSASIPVCAHIGLTPQSVFALSGYKVQGKTGEKARKLIEDAKAVEEAGAYMVVLECVPDALAKYISEMLTIPTIGIGAGNGCDGQVLVYADMMNMTDGRKPKFVKVFEDIGTKMTDAVKEYISEVQNCSFPDKEKSYSIDENIMKSIMEEK